MRSFGRFYRKGMVFQGLNREDGKMRGGGMGGWVVLRYDIVQWHSDNEL